MGSTVSALRRVPAVDEIVVVDDGSTDDTASEAAHAGACVVRLEPNRGKGAALAAGVHYARGDILAFLDADLGACAAEAETLLAPVLRGEADMSIATFPRVAGAGGGFGLVVGLARWGIARATGRSMAAPLSGQRALRRSVLDRVGGLASGFGVEVALTIDALRAGFRVTEVATTMSHRVTGRDLHGFVHRGRQFGAVVRVLLARAPRRC